MKKRSGSLYNNMMLVTILPILALGVIITLYCLNTYTDGMTQEVEIGLRNVALSIEATYDELYEGDFSVDVDGNFKKGEHILNGKYELIDTVKANSDVEISLICNDVRMLTTIMDSRGNRMVGTTISEKVSDWIKTTNSPYFSTSVVIDTDKYYGYYLPLKHSEDEKTYIIFVGMPQATVKGFINKSITRIVMISAICLVITMIITIWYAHGLISDIKKMTVFMGNVAKGSLRKELDESILNRNDELGRMGRHASYMQRALHTLVEQDMLTELYNRRSGDLQLKKLYEESVQEHKQITIAIADIDFFKGINDNYGHDAGDIVLKSIADILQLNIVDKGFVCRWGGEEFLFVFYEDSEEARRILENIRVEVEQKVVNYEDYNINITMTFGVATFENEESIEDLLKEADDNLYIGKNNGRNQVIG